jgi:hypothetical protein
MAVITAKFGADFNDFNTEVVKAEKTLDDFEKETVAAGGAITGLNKVSANSVPPVSELSSAYKQFDGVLQSAGVNIGPQVKAFEDLAAAATKGAGGLGTFTKAGLITGSFLEGWKLGRMIADFFDLDQAISEAAASIGIGMSTSAEIAAMKLDVMSRASVNAGRYITDYDEAIRVNTQSLKDRNEKLEESAKATKKAADEEAKARLALLDANNAITVAYQDHNLVLAEMDQRLKRQIQRDLEHSVSQRDVQLAYAATDFEMAAVIKKMEREAEARKKLIDLDKEAAEAMKKEADAIRDLTDKLLGNDLVKQAGLMSEAIKALGGNVANLRSEQLEELEKTMLAAVDAMIRSGQATKQQSSEFMQLAIAARQALDAMKPLVKVVEEDLVKAQWDYVTALDEANKKAEEVPAAMEPATGAFDAIGASAQQASSSIFQMSAELYNAIRAAQNADAMNALVPAWGITHPAPGQGIIRNVQPASSVQVNINSPLGTPDQIAKAVGNALTSGYSSGGGRLPV